MYKWIENVNSRYSWRVKILEFVAEEAAWHPVARRRGVEGGSPFCLFGFADRHIEDWGIYRKTFIYQ